MEAVNHVDNGNYRQSSEMYFTNARHTYFISLLILELITDTHETIKLIIQTLMVLNTSKPLSAVLITRPGIWECQ